MNTGDLVKSIEQSQQITAEYQLPPIVDDVSVKNCAAHLRVAEQQSKDPKRKGKGIEKNIKCVITAACVHDCILEAWPLAVPECWRSIAALFITLVLLLLRFPKFFSYDVNCRFWTLFFSKQFASIAGPIIAIIPALHRKSHNFK